MYISYHVQRWCGGQVFIAVVVSIDGWMDGWMDGRSDGRTDGSS